MVLLEEPGRTGEFIADPGCASLESGSRSSSEEGKRVPAGSFVPSKERVPIQAGNQIDRGTAPARADLS
jgi:hypothetical protein